MALQLRTTFASLLFAITTSCGSSAPPATSSPPPIAPPAPSRPDEPHLADLRQLTFGGENAEAYWSFDGAQLVFQARGTGAGCDRIYRMPVAQNPPVPLPLSSGLGATTCSYFLPGDREVIYASTHLGGPSCPPKPDHSQGYVWALYPTYDIFRAKLDGSAPARLTDSPGYDAEGTVCEKDGSIVFTSVRDGDIELYRMDADGKNVRRLTNAPGYDGGAYFNADCTKIVWRASRPEPGKELDDYKELLARGLVRPTKLELYVANADGSDPTQITYLDAASFAPSWHPSQRRIIFSSNYGDPKGREFNLWAIDIDGTNLEQITFAPGFDGFPMFSPDGRFVAFSSNRATPPGQHDTNVFVARWNETPPQRALEMPADRIMADIRWLADPAREGRGIGTRGLEESERYIESRYRALGLRAADTAGTYRQDFDVTVSAKIEDSTSVTIGRAELERDVYQPLGFSASGEARGDLVLAGYGISDKNIGVDDYEKVDAKGKIVVVRRFVPEGSKFAERDAQRRYGDLRYKVWTARERGAVGVIVVDAPLRPEGTTEWKMPDESHLPSFEATGPSDAGIPAVAVKRAAMLDLLAKLAKRQRVHAEIRVALTKVKASATNVVARLGAGAAESLRLPGVVVLGAHYDHLGMGERDSLAPDRHEPHVGADDNASGTAVLLEAARELVAHKPDLRRDVVFASFSGEEEGVLGSTQFTRSPPGGLDMKNVVAMINADMVGRMRDDKVSVLGSDSADGWTALLGPVCKKERIACALGGDGYGPSDQTPFFAAGVPVIHFFTGAHFDYHKPSDTADKINGAGAAQIARAMAEAALAVAARPERLALKQVPSPAPHGDMRTFNASLGTIPDYAGPPGGQKGVLLAGVRPGGGAEAAGMRRGDILTRLGTHAIGGVEDLMFVLNAAKPGQTVTAVVLRDGKEVKVEATFQESKRAH